MAYIKDRQDNINTVGELIESLKRFPNDMRVHGSFDDPVKVYREEFEEMEECYEEGERSAIYIDS